MRKISKTLRSNLVEARGNTEERGAEKPSEDSVSRQSELHAMKLIGGGPI